MKVNFLIVSFLILLFTCSSASAWYNDDWSHRIPIEINNSGNPALINCQFNVSFISGINDTSIRVVNKSDNSIVPHWCENETEGLCYELWVNVSISSEINNDYYIYYGNDAVISTSSYDDTFTKKYNDSGLVLEMHMDEGTGYLQINDTSGCGNHGTLTNMNVTGNDTSGWQGTDGGQWDNRSDVVFATGGQLRFDGVNDYVDCVCAESGFSSNDFTISMWSNPAYLVGASARTSFICQKDGASYDYVLRKECGSGKLEFLGGSTNLALSNISLRGGYNHITIVYDSLSTSINFFFNGVAAGTTNVGTFSGSNENIYIGAYWYNGGFIGDRYFNGSMDEVRIYNRTLSTDEIYRQYIRSKYAIDVPIVTLGTSEQPKHVNISLYSKYPDTLLTNYTGLLTSSYIVESNYPLNLSSLAFLMGINYTLTNDYHSYLKVPTNSIANDGIYRAHNRNISFLMNWESNDTITEGNVWKWAGGDINDFWIANKTINSTHTWINITGIASNVFPSMFYLGRQAIYESEKTGIEINKGQGIIFKIWDLEQFRGRSHDYYLSLFFDSDIETIPDSDIEIWYCNDSFNPLTDNPCLGCDYKDTWTSN